MTTNDTSGSRMDGKSASWPTTPGILGQKNVHQTVNNAEAENFAGPYFVGTDLLERVMKVLKKKRFCTKIIEYS